MVKPNESIDTIKNLIHDENEEYIPEQQILTYDKKTLSGKLDHYGVKNGDVLELKMAPITVNVKSFDGTSIPMEVTASNTVDELKTRVYNETEVLPRQQHMFLQTASKGNKRLTSGSLGSNGVKSGSKIHVAGANRGG
ncbi:uncharacterized protein LOC144422866 [Styela clava]